MSQLDHVEMHFSGGEESPELTDYRPISPLVIVACLTALASFLAVIHALLWIVPMVAVVLSACAIRQVSAPQSRYGGRFAASVALCFAALIGAYAPARALSLEREYYTRAQTHAEKWISLVQQGRYHEAHQLGLGPSQRFKGPGALADHYNEVPKIEHHDSESHDPDSSNPGELMMDPPAGEQLAGFLREAVVEKIVEYGPQASIAHVENVTIGKVHGGVVVKQRFRLSGMHEGQPGSFEFFVNSTRWESDGGADWQFDRLREVD